MELTGRALYRIMWRRRDGIIITPRGRYCIYGPEDADFERRRRSVRGEAIYEECDPIIFLHLVPGRRTYV